MARRVRLGSPGIARLCIRRTTKLAIWLWGCLGLWCSVFAGAASAQTFVEQGPAPRFGPAYAVQSADAAPNGTEAGAIQAILPDPALGAGTIFAGSPNGGIWVTSNNGASWTPLTDKQASLSIASLALDPTDRTGKTIIAGVGITDNGEYSQFNQTVPQGRGGARTGVLYSNDGGATWSALGTSTLAGQSVIGVQARGQTILAATYEVQDARMNTAGYGLYRSVNGGATFSLVSGAAGSGLPAGAVTSLVASPSDANTFYAAVKTSTDKAATSVYYTNNNGATWSPIFTAADSHGTINSGAQTVITLAAGPNGSVAVAVSNLEDPRSLAGVFLTTNSGTSWKKLSAPDVVPGNQTPVNLHVAVDPHNGNVVYLSGDAYQNCGTNGGSFCSIKAFRLVYDPNTNTSSYASLTDQGTFAQKFLNANTVHADSRAMAFDAAGNLLLSSDGGIYRLTNPSQTGGTWQGLNGNLGVFEPYMVAYDANSKRLAMAAQDNGSSLQSAPGGKLFNAVNLGDGTNVAVNDRTLPGLSAIYTTLYNISFLSRIIVNAQGQVVSPFPDPVNNPGGVPVTCNGGQNCTNVTGAGNSFSAPLVLNKIDPTRIAIGGGTDVYVTRDTLSGSNGVSATAVDLHLVDLSATPTAGPSVISYGTQDNVHAIAVGAGTGGPGEVWFSSSNASGSLGQLTNYAGNTPTSIVFDTRTQSRIFVADSTDVFYTQNATTTGTFTTLTSNLPAGFVRPTALEFIANNGVNALLVGGLNTPLTCGSGPNACTNSSQQSPITVADSSATGALSGWRAFGTNLPNALIYQMAYNPTVDVLAVGSVGRGGWLLYDVTSYFPQASVLQFGLANNNSNPDASLLTNGTVGSRPLIKYGTGTLTIDGTATYSGSTTVNGGILEVDGKLSNTSSVTVNSTGILTGVGTVDPLVVTFNAGATFAPGAVGAPGTSMTIGGNLALQSGALYLVQLNATSSTFADVSGTASLAGTALAVFAAGTALPARQYTILVSGGLNGTTFAALATQNLPSGFNASLGYTANDVLLNVTATLGSGAGLNGNQQSVANVLNNAFNSGATLPANFSPIFGLSGAALGGALTQLSGESATGAERGAFQLMTQFLGIMLDPFVDGRNASRSGGGRLGFAPDEPERLPPDIASAYAAVLKAPPKANFDDRWTAWGSAYGAANTASGSAAVGSNTVTTSTFGFAAGMDYHLSPDTIAGFGLAGGGLSWGLANSLGGGRSDSFQIGFYGVSHAGPAYLAGALAFANHWFTMNRTALGNQLNANFDGQSYAARLEGGYRYAVLPRLGVTPYAALQAQDFHTPSYSESDLSGGGLGLSYAAMTATDVRTELGARFESPMVVAGKPLVLRARTAWAHDFVSNPALSAAFQFVPGGSFTVNGAPIPRDSALTTAGAELFLLPNWTLLAKFDGEFAPGSQTYAGTGTLRYTW